MKSEDAVRRQIRRFESDARHFEKLDVSANVNRYRELKRVLEWVLSGEKELSVH